MKASGVIIIFLLLLLAGCTSYYIAPEEGPYIEESYIEPLPSQVIIERPVIVSPPRGIVVTLLPPVVVTPGRHLYFYKGVYYYYWDGIWLYSKRARGQWYRLPKRYYPSRYHKGPPPQKRHHKRGRGHCC